MDNLRDLYACTTCPDCGKAVTSGPSLFEKWPCRVCHNKRIRTRLEAEGLVEWPYTELPRGVPLHLRPAGWTDRGKVIRKEFVSKEVVEVFRLFRSFLTYDDALDATGRHWALGKEGIEAAIASIKALEGLDWWRAVRIAFSHTENVVSSPDG